MSEEDLKELGRILYEQINERRRKLYLEDRKKPLCEKVFHPFLGKECFKDTCPMCGYKVVNRDEEEK